MISSYLIDFTQNLAAHALLFGLLAALGKFASQYCPPPIARIEVMYCGTAAEYDLSAMTTALIKGFLIPQIEEAVNDVNARYLAKSRGIDYRRSQGAQKSHFST